MTTAEAKRLNPGDRVIFDGNPQDIGTVTEKGYESVTILWHLDQKPGTVHVSGLRNMELTHAESDR